MLARHAEDLFWIGRYVERAEDTARLLDVTHQTALEGGVRSSDELWRELLEVLYLDDVFADDAEPESVTRFLVADRDHDPDFVARMNVLHVEHGAGEQYAAAMGMEEALRIEGQVFLEVESTTVVLDEEVATRQETGDDQLDRLVAAGDDVRHRSRDRRRCRSDPLCFRLAWLRRGELQHRPSAHLLHRVRSSAGAGLTLTSR